MQNPLSGSRTTTPANEQTASQGQNLTNPLTRNSQSANMSTLGADMDIKVQPESEDTQSKHKDVESAAKGEADGISEIEHQEEASLVQGTGVLPKIKEPSRGAKDDKNSISASPSAEVRTTTEPPSLPLASDIGRETTVSSSKKHETEKREAAEGLLILNQGKLPKRKRTGPGVANSRAPSKRRNKDSDELEYLGTRSVLRPLYPRPVTPQQEARSNYKRHSAEQRARTVHGRNHTTPNGSNFNMAPIPYPTGTGPLASQDFVLSTRPGLPPAMHTAAPSAPYYPRPADYAYPSATHSHSSSLGSQLSYPPTGFQHSTQQQQQVAQVPVLDRNTETNGRWRDCSHLIEAAATTAGQNNLYPLTYPELVQIGPSGYPLRPETLILMNLATRNAHLQPPSPHPSAPHPPISRNFILPPPTCTASTRYASLSSNFGALDLARGQYDSNTYFSTEYQKYQQIFANARAPVDLQRELDFIHWRNRHSQKWVRQASVYDGSGDYAAERLPKLVEPTTTPTRKPVAMEAQGMNMGGREAQDAHLDGVGKVSRRKVVGKRPWEL